MKKVTLNFAIVILSVFLFVSCYDASEGSQVTVEESNQSLTLESEGLLDVQPQKTKSLFTVPVEYEDLAVGKALKSIDFSNGYIVEFVSGNDFCSKFVGKGNNALHVLRQKDHIYNIDEKILSINNEVYLLDDETKTYTVLESYDFNEINLFLELEYSESRVEEINGVEYEVDKFISSGNVEFFEEFYVANGKLEFHKKIFGEVVEKYDFSVSYDNVEDYLVLPQEYIQQSLKDVVSEYFTVPDKFKEFEIGKALSKCNVEKGFYFTVNNTEENSDGEKQGYYTVYKGDKAYVAQYDIVEGAPTQYTKREVYKDGKRYEFEELLICVENDPLGKGLKMQNNFFDGYSFVGKNEKIVEGINCVVETFSVEGKGLVEFYFHQGEFCGVESEDGFIVVLLDTSGDIEENIFD